MKKFLSFILSVIIVCLSFSSCLSGLYELNGRERDVVQEEFSRYYNGKQEVAMLMYSSLCFNGYEINLNELIPGEEFNDGLLIKNNKIYFSTTTCFYTHHLAPKPEEYTLNIYESDLSGTEISLIYSIKSKDRPWESYAKDDSFYIQYLQETEKLFELDVYIDKYTISTGECVTIASGSDCSLNDYKATEESQYEIDVV